MPKIAPQESLLKRHAILFYLLLFSLGILIAGMATIELPVAEGVQTVYSGTMSSVAAALMVATVLFAIRFWFMIGSNDLFLRRTGNVEGSQTTGLVRVFDRMEDYGTDADWIDLLRNCKEHMDIMGRTAFGWTNHPQIASLLESQIKRQGVRFRWLIMGPGNPFLPTLREKNTSIGGMLQRKILATTNTLLSVRAALPENLKSHLQVRHFNDTPLYFSLTRADYKLLITHYQSSKDSKTCPMSQVYGIDSTWGESHLAEFAELWRNSRDVSSQQAQLAGPELRLDQRILEELQEDHHRAAQRVIEDNRADFSNFNKGWRILLSELVTGNPRADRGSSRPPTDRRPVLRDFTASGQGGLTCQCWNLRKYPQTLAFNLDETLDRDYEARFLIVCEDSPASNTVAEIFLRDLLKIVYNPSSLPECPITELFAKWQECFETEDMHLKIRLSCEPIANRVAGAERALLRHPFNVYDTFCVSRSVLTLPNDPRNPAPHLEMLWNRDTVAGHLSLFDKIWEESIDHQRAIFSTPTEELNRLGDGQLFSKWSSERRPEGHLDERPSTYGDMARPPSMVNDPAGETREASTLVRLGSKDSQVGKQ